MVTSLEFSNSITKVTTMLRLLSIFSLLVLVGILSGCGSMYKKQYTYIPPQAAADKRCIGKCMHARSYCQKICLLKNKKSCDCTTSFNTCYSACGGQVIEK